MTTEHEPTTQAEFFEKHAVDGTLPPHLWGQMISLPEGDSVGTTQGGTPDPAPDADDTKPPAPPPAPAPEPAPPAPSPAPAPAPAADPEPKPTILAKDGVHTIGYEKLEEARNAEKAAKAEAEAAKAEAERLRQELAQATAQAPAAPAPAPAPAPAAKVDFGDFSDEALAKGIEALVEKRVAERVDARLTPIEQQREAEANAAHWRTIYEKHPNLDSMLQSKELESWIVGKPSFEQAAARAVLKKGTAGQVIELFDSFKKASAPPPPAPAPSPAPAPAADAAAEAAAKAAKAVADAKGKPPSSLSEIPGNAGPADEAQAMLDMSPTALMARFNGKSPEEIHRALSKVL